MGKTLEELAEQLAELTSPHTQLIYAFNGVGKTRLSRIFKEHITSREEEGSVLYYNAFTEDLFYWDNDLQEDRTRKLLIQDNSFLKWSVERQGNEKDIVRHFQRYIGKPIDAQFEFNEGSSSISFSLVTGDIKTIRDIKVSKGEESCFIWSLFYTVIKGIIDSRNEGEDTYPNLKYIFIDDPVSSLDENHLVELAVDITKLIEEAPADLKFIISTHNSLFYNVIRNALNSREIVKKRKGSKKEKEKEKKFKSSILTQLGKDSYRLLDWPKDTPFPYHLYLLREIEKALLSNEGSTEDTTQRTTKEIKIQVEKYHFAHLRYILEKTAIFLGYKHWSDLLPKENNNDRASYYSRLINIFNHGKAVTVEGASLSPQDQGLLQDLIKYLKSTYHMNTDHMNTDHIMLKER